MREALQDFLWAFLVILSYAALKQLHVLGQGFIWHRRNLFLFDVRNEEKARKLKLHFLIIRVGHISN
jgi:hypothetical protein